MSLGVSSYTFAQSSPARGQPVHPQMPVRPAHEIVNGRAANLKSEP